MVLETQQWLNKTYGGVAGFGSVPENGKTGWTTTNALIRATQIELGITNLVDNFGPTTSQYWDSKFAGALVPGFNHNVVKIIEGGFWAKGINPEDFTGQFSTHTQQAIIELKSDAGISDTSAVADSTFMAMLLTMDQFVLVPGGDSNVRKIQRTLNHDYQDYTGVMPADGIYQRGTNEALIYALQAAEGMGAGTANGVYGPGTISGTPTIGVGATGAFVRVLQWGLYVNGYNQNAVFDGVYSSYIGSQVSAFRSFMALGGGTSADLDVFKGLLTSNGNVNRDVDGFDTSTQLTAANAQMLANAGFKYAGRYLTGSAGTHASGTYHEKGLSRDELQNLFNAGLKVFLIYQDGA